MRMTSVREFRDGATRLLRSRDPILITRRGRVAGIFFPRPESSLPLELKKEIFPALAADIARQLKKRRISEAEVLADFETWSNARSREAHREARS